LGDAQRTRITNSESNILPEMARIATPPTKKLATRRLPNDATTCPFFARIALFNSGFCMHRKVYSIVKLYQVDNSWRRRVDTALNCLFSSSLAFL